MLATGRSTGERVEISAPSLLLIRSTERSIEELVLACLLWVDRPVGRLANWAFLSLVCYCLPELPIRPGGQPRLLPEPLMSLDMHHCSFTSSALLAASLLTVTSQQQPTAAEAALQ